MVIIYDINIIIIMFLIKEEIKLNKIEKRLKQAHIENKLSTNIDIEFNEQELESGYDFDNYINNLDFNVKVELEIKAQSVNGIYENNYIDIDIIMDNYDVIEVYYKINANQDLETSYIKINGKQYNWNNDEQILGEAIRIYKEYLYKKIKNPSSARD